MHTNPGPSDYDIVWYTELARFGKKLLHGVLNIHINLKENKVIRDQKGISEKGLVTVHTVGKAFKDWTKAYMQREAEDNEDTVHQCWSFRKYLSLHFNQIL